MSDLPPQADPSQSQAGTTQAGPGLNASAPTGPPPADASGHSLCAYCQTGVESEESSSLCPVCGAVYHAECWNENGGCAVYGCSQVPQIEQRRSIDIPAAFWGRENKPCPACGREILAAALRCRHCGATFASAQPEDVAAFQQRKSLQERLPKARQTIVWLFICSVVPCTAPIGGIWSLIWYPSHKQEVTELPSLYAALCKIGMVVGLGQTVMFVLMAILHSMRSNSGSFL